MAGPHRPGRPSRRRVPSPEPGSDCRSAEALRTRLDITRITPDLLRFVLERTHNRDLKDACYAPTTRTSSPNSGWGRQAVDLRRGRSPSVPPPARMGRRAQALQPRLYSISSSPLAHPTRVHLTVSASATTTGPDRARASARRSSPTAGEAHRAGLRAALAAFRLPADPATPMIMVGPGTGVAPFRGFLQDASARGATGPNWLFFGDQRRATDFFYRDELERAAAPASSTASTWRSPATRRRRSTSRTGCASTAPSCGLAPGRRALLRLRRRRAGWPRTSTRRCADRRRARRPGPRTTPTRTSSSWRPKALCPGRLLTTARRTFSDGYGMVTSREENVLPGSTRQPTWRRPTNPG